ncbi:hypothetical protein SESBI_35377 [Sesbania bispinosa]|nr:hypothetical protein SESBI_35377 [Sesbania bispinosa]
MPTSTHPEVLQQIHFLVTPYTTNNEPHWHFIKHQLNTTQKMSQVNSSSFFFNLEFFLSFSNFICSFKTFSLYVSINNSDAWQQPPPQLKSTNLSSSSTHSNRPQLRLTSCNCQQSSPQLRQSTSQKHISEGEERNNYRIYSKHTFQLGHLRNLFPGFFTLLPAVKTTTSSPQPQRLRDNPEAEDDLELPVIMFIN